MIMTAESMKEAIVDRLETTLGIPFDQATERDIYVALSTLVKEQVSKNWTRTTQTYKKQQERQVTIFLWSFYLDV